MKVALGFPGSHLTFEASRGLHTASLGRHEVTLIQSALGAWDAFNVLWVDAMNMAAAGEITHYAMLHSDSDVPPGWLDTLIEECEEFDANAVSAIVAIKDARGLADCGIGDPADPWRPYRRFTMHEIHRLPESFDAAMIGYPGQMLLSGTGCLVCDLRRPIFQTVSPDGSVPICFNFPTRVIRDAGGQYHSQRESEDWYFSRMLWKHGGKLVATRKVRLGHIGNFTFPNWEPWGQFKNGDQESKWAKQRAEKTILTTGAWTEDSELRHRFDPGFAAALCERLQGQMVFDLGCGPGRYVAALREEGIASHGCDGNPNTVTISASPDHVFCADLTNPLPAAVESDWALCLEVAEHIPPEFEEKFLENLFRVARKGVIISWCVPGEDGFGHVNAQPPEYVTKIFRDRGFLELNPTALRAASTLPWFRSNIRIFERKL